MKVRSIAVNQFKKFTTPVCVETIADGLNVVVGPNEMGKSTLLDALRAALFEKHSSKAQQITDLQNDRNQAAPVVELVFEVDEGTYRIRKRFVKKPYAHLFCPDGRKLEGEEAEDTLRRLLGFEEPGNRGANAETLGMWNVLWVRQGRSFGILDLPQSARSSLHSALESQVGEVLGGRRGRALPDAVAKQLAELVTSTGRPRGQYKELIDASESLQSEFDDLRGRRRDLSETMDELDGAQETLARLASPDRDTADKTELDRVRGRHGELAKLETRIQAATSDVELKKLNLERAEQASGERRALKEKIQTETGAVEEAQKRFDEVREADQTLKKQIQRIREEAKKAEEAVTESDRVQSHARRVLAACQRDSRLRELQGHLEKADAAEKRQRAAQQQAATILVTAKSMETIRDAARKLEAARSRLSAAATLITFDMPSERFSKIKVDGAVLATDQISLKVVEGMTIEIPDYGSVSIQPAIKDRDKLIAQRHNANEALHRTLDECGVKSVETAEEQYAKREKLLRDAALAKQEAELHAPAREDHPAGAQSLADHIAGMKVILNRELMELGIEKVPLQSEAEHTLASAEEHAREARDTLTLARAALLGPEEEMGRIQTEMGVAKTRYVDGRDRLETLKNELAEAEKRISDEDLDAAVSLARKRLTDQQEQVSDLEKQRGNETLPQLEARMSRLESSLQDRHEKRSRLKETIAGLRSHIEVLEGAGLDELIQQKAREMERVDEQRQRIEREVKVLSLLLATLRSAENEAKQRYLSPVLNKVRPYLRLLFPSADITIDENLHIVGVVREEGHEEAFHHLSLGTQEQIAVLVRLAFAEMLVEQGHPATVVLDDALVFSDDHRMGRMFDILNMVGRRVQVILLTCREQMFEGVGGCHLHLKSGEGKELESA